MDGGKIEDRPAAAHKPEQEQSSERLLASAIEPPQASQSGHVTGIGGVFFRSHGDPKILNEWYTKNLGINIDEKYGLGIIPWSDRKTDNGAATAWKSAEDTTQWFGPSKADFMINYTVDNMADIFERLKANKANILEGPGCHEKRPEAYENGKFLWVLDPDGNKVELWEPKKWDPKNKEDCAISSD